MLSRVQRQLQRQALASARQCFVRPGLASAAFSPVRSFATAPATTGGRVSYTHPARSRLTLAPISRSLAQLSRATPVCPFCFG